MKVLFSLSSGASIRFHPDGFELDARDMPIHEAIEEIERTLQSIAEKIKKDGL